MDQVGTEPAELELEAPEELAEVEEQEAPETSAVESPEEPDEPAPPPTAVERAPTVYEVFGELSDQLASLLEKIRQPTAEIVSQDMRFGYPARSDGAAKLLVKFGNLAVSLDKERRLGADPRGVLPGQQPLPFDAGNATEKPGLKLVDSDGSGVLEPQSELPWEGYAVDADDADSEEVEEEDEEPEPEPLAPNIRFVSMKGEA